VRLRLALLLVLLTDLSVSVAQERGVFVLAPTRTATELLAPCSRLGPQSVDGYWTPSTQEVTEPESLLESFLRTDPTGKSVLPLDQYHRQYIGFMRGGKRFIYGNFYPAPTQITSRYDESTQPVLVCDGGRRFWGIVFSVESKTFVDLAFNGVA